LHLSANNAYYASLDRTPEPLRAEKFYLAPLLLVLLGKE